MRKYTYTEYSQDYLDQNRRGLEENIMYLKIKKYYEKEDLTTYFKFQFAGFIITSLLAHVISQINLPIFMSAYIITAIMWAIPNFCRLSFFNSSLKKIENNIGEEPRNEVIQVDENEAVRIVNRKVYIYYNNPLLQKIIKVKIKN